MKRLFLFVDVPRAAKSPVFDSVTEFTDEHFQLPLALRPGALGFAEAGEKDRGPLD